MLKRWRICVEDLAGPEFELHTSRTYGTCVNTRDTCVNRSAIEAVGFKTYIYSVIRDVRCCGKVEVVTSVR